VKNFVGVFGHVVMDYIVTLRRLPKPNTSIEILDRQRYFGGTGGNLARAAARLGVKASLASFVGDDFPDDYRTALHKDGVDTADLRAVRGANTPTAWVFSDSRGNQMAVIDQGPMKEAARFPVLRHSVRDVELVHLATGRPEYYVRVAELAESLGRTIAFDPSQEIHYVYTPRLFRALLSRSKYFFGNETEIVRAKRLARVTSTEGLLRITTVVVATLGSRGSAVYTREGRIRIPRVPPGRRRDRCRGRIPSRVLRGPRPRVRLAAVWNSRVRGREFRRREKRDAVESSDMVPSSPSRASTCNAVM